MKARITRVEAIPVNYPVAGRFKFFEAPDGRPLGRGAVVVKIATDDGTIGWGQSVPTPRWSYETMESVLTTIERYLGPALIGLDPLEAEAVRVRMNQTIAPSFSIGQPICKAGIDLALFDLTGKLRGQSAAEQWQRTDLQRVVLSWTLNPRTLEEAESSIAEAQQRGYEHFNVKIAPDLTFDLELCRLVKQRAPGGVLWVDANGGYDEAGALEAAPRLADLGVAFFEQPVAANRLSAFARLRKQGALPIIMDEGVVSLVDLQEFHRLNLLDGVAIKPARSGGLGEARRQIEYLQENGLIFLGSGLTDPDISLAGSLSLFGAHGLKYPAALNGPQYLNGSMLERPFEVEQGSLKVPAGIGLGVTVDEEKLKSLRVKLFE